MHSKRGLIRPRDLTLAVTASAIIVVLHIVGWGRPVERSLSDLQLRLAGRLMTAQSLVTAVVIDDRSVEAVGPVPWSRDDLAVLVDRIAAHKPRALVIDMLLTDIGHPRDDERLGKSFHQLDVVLAAALSPEGGWLLPNQRFGGVVAGAHGHAETDTDGIVRSIAATKQADGLALPALAVSAAKRGGWSEPVIAGRRLYPDFREGPLEIPRISAADVLDGRVSQPALTDQVVFLGYTSTGATDQFLVPVGPRNHPVPGVLVHAAAASSVLRGGLLRPTPLWAVAVVILLVAWSTQLLRSRSGRFRLHHLGIVIFSVVLASCGALVVGHLLVPAVALILAASLSVAFREAYESAAAQAEAGSILRSLVADEPETQSLPTPRGVQGRLALVKVLQARLTRDRNLRKSLLEGMNEGVVLWDRSGNPLLSNRALVHLWGHEPTLGELQQEHQHDEPSSVHGIRRGARDLEAEVLVLEDGHLGLVRDITERAELDRRRQEMHRLVSHELKTPLASLSGFGEMLQTYDLSGEELHEVAGTIRAEADRLGEMVRVYLDIERLETGHWEAELADVDLASLVESRRQILASATVSKRQSIEVESEPCPSVRGVEQLLSRMIDNLIGNALKYSADGGVVHVRVGPDSEGLARLEVRDRGSGIPSDAVPRLFERFYRVPGAKAQGSGLGLALVKEVSDWHGASILVDSVVGEGSCFTVVFPQDGEQK